MEKGYKKSSFEEAQEHLDGPPGRSTPQPV